MSLTTAFSVQKLQTALHAKAKESPNTRFHALYDKVYRKDVLAHAYERCQANGGAAGVDSQTFENIEAYGRERWLDELTLKSRTYRPQPVRRVYIPKPDGKQRPLGIMMANLDVSHLGYATQCAAVSLRRTQTCPLLSANCPRVRRLQSGFEGAPERLHRELMELNPSIARSLDIKFVIGDAECRQD
jgi:hypothetical protein